MMVKRGDIWLADLDPTRGSEQAGMRPVLIFQNDIINAYTTTALVIPLTTNLRRAELPSCVRITKGISHERRPFTSGCIKISPPSRQARQVFLLFADLQIC